MWSASFYFGNFVGPTLSGISVDVWGFKYTTLVLSAVFIFSLIVDTLDLSFKTNKSNICGPKECGIIEEELRNTENNPLLANNCFSEEH